MRLKRGEGIVQGMNVQPDRMRVAFFGADFSRRARGTALVVQNLANDIALRYQDEIELVLIRPPGTCTGVVCERARSVIVSRRFSTLLSYFWFFLSHRDAYDVVVFNRVLYPGFSFLNARRFVLIAHDASVSEVYSVPRTGVLRFFELVVRLSKGNLSAILAMSEDAKNNIAAYFRISEEKIRVLYLAASDTYKPSTDAEKLAVRQKFGGAPFILDVSRFDPHKNIERVLAAFFQIKQTGVPHKLVLVGGAHTPGYSEMIEKMISSSKFADDVVVLDYVEDAEMPKLYASAEVLLYPSLVEGFGLPIIEAFASGTPVVTSNISAMPEISAGAAILVDPLEIDTIAAGVRRVLDDSSLRTELVKKGLRRASEFSWKNTTDEFVRILRILVK